MRSLRRCLILAAALALGAIGVPAANSTPAVDALVTVASPSNTHPQNAQNEPALAVNPTRPNVLAAGANDLVDMQPCSQQASTTAGAARSRWEPSTWASASSGSTSPSTAATRWAQPTYSGAHRGRLRSRRSSRARHMPARSTPFRTTTRTGCAPAATPAWPSVPRPRRTAVLLGQRVAAVLLDARDQPHRHADRSTGEPEQQLRDHRVAHRRRHAGPGRRSVATGPSRTSSPAHVARRPGLDKEQIWADNAASSPFFGNVYVCYSDFHSFSRGNAFPL